MSDLSVRDARRNMAILLFENVSFSAGLTLLGLTTIVPNLVRLLGGGPLAVGSIEVIHVGGWLLPQLVAGRYTANRPLVKKYTLVPGLAGRILMALALVVVWWSAERAPGLALGALLFALLAFWMGDGLCNPGWMDLLGKGIPQQWRGRLLGAAQALSSLLGVGAGALVGVLLGGPRPFPRGYLLLLALACASFTAGMLGIALLREPRGVVHSEQLPWREYFPRLLAILRSDARFGWLTILRWLAGLADMAAGFYVLYAGDRLHVPAQALGLFVGAGVVGGFLAGTVLGPLGDRRGSARVIRVAMVLRCLCPALALFAPLVAGWHPWVAPGLLVLAFAAMGAINGTNLIGFLNYLLEIAPPAERSIYVALGNALTGLLMLAPLVAGVVVKLASYEFLLALTLALAGLGLLLALRGPRGLARWWRVEEGAIP